jgi:NADH-quinone oxidoreductase subunit L
MLALLWLVPVLPLAGFMTLTFFGARLSRTGIAVIGAGSVGLSAVVTALVSISFLTAPPPDQAYTQTLWTWIATNGFQVEVAFYLDALSMVMILVITLVSFLIHLYSTEYMIEDEGYRRFFAYMNLFVGSMLILVLADNLLLLYLGWEGVGLCSYLLIGFWYTDPVNGRAARKAFVVTRVGDAVFAIGLFLLVTQLGTLKIQELMTRATQTWSTGSALAVSASLLLLGGALGKSAQLPLQTWLPDAMAGPSPVSALIHAATMVTAGVYLIARTNDVFALAPSVMRLVGLIGASTLLLAGFSALVQRDIKRVLAYSTMSQIGYMFLALGVGAWSAAIFHFMIHAFFKALLFLGAGAIILAVHHDHDMFHMGGLRHKLPFTFWTFLIGACSLAAFPLLSAGFFSKDLILFEAYASGQGSTWLWLAGLAGALLTSLYAFRMVFLTFFGQAKTEPDRVPGVLMKAPMLFLAVLSVFAGVIELPGTLGNHPLFTDFLHNALPSVALTTSRLGQEGLLQIISGVVSLLGIFLAYVFILRVPDLTARFAHSAAGSTLHRFWYAGWGFDWLYDRVFVWPYASLARKNKDDVIDIVYDKVAELARILHGALSSTESGQLRRYATGIVFGAVVTIALVVLL